MQLGFNAQQHDPSMGFDPWPDGWVPVIITASDGKPTSTGGGMLGLTLQAVDGPLKGKTAFLGLNLWHANPQTVEIANKVMSAITYVTIGVNKGTLQFNATEELHNIPFLVLASRQKDDPTRNEFRQFRDIRGNDPKGQPPATTLVLAGAGGPTGAPQQPPGGFAPPAQGFTPPGGQPAPQPAGNAGWGATPPQQQPPQGFAPPQQQQPAPAFQPPQQQQPQPAFQPPAGGGFAPPQGQPQQQTFQPPVGAPQQQQQPSWAPPAGGAPAPAWGPR